MLFRYRAACWSIEIRRKYGTKEFNMPVQFAQEDLRCFVQVIGDGGFGRMFHNVSIPAGAARYDAFRIASSSSLPIVSTVDTYGSERLYSLMTRRCAGRGSL